MNVEIKQTAGMTEDDVHGLQALLSRGGTAFPHLAVYGAQPGPTSAINFSGMSLRDYFAAATLQGYIAHVGYAVDPEQVSAHAFRIADAMLAERAKESPVA